MFNKKNLDGMATNVIPQIFYFVIFFTLRLKGTSLPV